MEANDHFNFTGLPPAPAASGLKPSPSGEGLYTNGSPMNFPQQGKSLNGDVNVNGLSTVSHTTTSGILNSAPHSSSTSHLHHPNVAYDCLWNYSQYPSANTGSNLKDPPLLSQFSGGQYPLNGILGSSRQPSSPSHNTNLRAGNQEFWANSTQSPMGLNFDSQELYDSFPDQNFEVMPNGPPSFFTSPQTSPMLGSSIQTFAPSQEVGSGIHADEATEKELTAVVAENGTGLVGSLELEEEQPELKMCGYNGSVPSVESLHPEVSVLVPDPTVSCLGDPSHLPEQLEDTPILSEDSLEPFDSLAAEPVSGGLYGIDDAELMGAEDKLPLEDSPVISALDCPSLNNAAAFSLLADDSQTSASIFASPASPPVLGESVLQENSFDLNNGSDAEQDELASQASAFSPPLVEAAPGPPSTLQLHPPASAAALSLAVSPAASPATGAGLPAVSSEAALSGPVTSPTGSPVPSPAAALPAVSATPEVSSFPEAPAVLAKGAGEGVPAAGNGDVLRRRVATPEEVRLPLQHGWRREVRIKKGSQRWQGETWYYGPCGKRMKQFPEVIKYLSRNMVPSVRREHFSFSPRMPVGDFFEERDTPEGLQWVQLSAEEIPSRIQAITGKRGRPRNTEKSKSKEVPKVKRGRGRPPKVRVPELLTKADHRLLKEPEAQETPNEEEKAKMGKSKKKVRQKVQRGESQPTQGQPRNKRKQETKGSKQKDVKKKSKAVEKEKVKTKQEKLKEKVKREKKEKVKTKEKEEMARGKAVGKADRSAATRRRLEERQRQQAILEEMRKPTEDMCLPDHQPLPDFSRIPGLTLPSGAFSDCLTVIEFLHSFGKVLGFDPTKDVPSLGVLQEGLLCQGDSLGEVQDLLVRLLKAALCDPGLPSYCQSLKILGEKVSEITLTRDNVSEILRCFLMAYGVEPALCDSLRTQPFQAQPPHQKAAVLAFLVHELNGSALIINEIDKTLESMSSYRKNKWIVEGRLRRLKTALAKRTGRSEVELEGLEESLGRRRSSRIMEETSGLEEEEEEEAAAAVHGRRGRRDGEVDATTSSIPELERQIERLSKRQLFFRKKLLHSSQMLRAVSLGQDRYRRRYWVLPCLAGIFVEGTEEESLVPEDVIKQEMDSFEVAAYPVSSSTLCSVKREPSGCSTPATSPARARGRPRKTKSGSLQHRRSKSPSRGQDVEEPQVQPQAQCCPQLQAPAQPQPCPLLHNGFLEPEGSPVSLGQSQHDLSQSAFLSWLSQTQSHGSLLSSSVLTPDSSPGKLEPVPSQPPEGSEPEEAGCEPGTAAPWFSFSARMPCNAAPTPPPAGSEDQPTCSPQLLACSKPGNRSSAASLCSPVTLSSTPLPGVAPKRQAGDPAEMTQSFTDSGQPKRRGRPPSKFFKQMEQRYLTQLTAQPVPSEMRSGWWWIRDPAMVDATLKALHPRGIREKALHKHLHKHRDFLQEVCLRPSADSIFEPCQQPALQEELMNWCPKEKTYETDLAVLQWVEELEQRVILSDLQIRGWTCPSPDSIREDLAYCEHLLDAQEDITWRGRGREGLVPQRTATNPLDLAVTRLAALEQNVERRYLREPLWPAHEVVLEKALLSTPNGTPPGTTTEISYEITPRIRLWRQTLERCRSAAQVCLCLTQLERSIAWEKSVNKVTCLVCRKGDNDEFLLLCDGCDRGCHIYCHRPKMEAVPEGDWFCAVCLAQQVEEEFPQRPGFPKRGQKRKSSYALNFFEGESRRRRVLSRGRDSPATPRSSEQGLSPSKRRRLSMRNHHSDLTFCEIILMEMESHDAAWPFLEPVNPRLVSGYRRIIKNPMDFSTMRERLLRGGYTSSEEFAADALLVFDNCQTFNEDDSEAVFDAWKLSSTLRMVMNLCLPQFRPRIHCNKISADGYEVENLISEDPTKRSHGFRTEYFIKPPVYVIVSFPFNVEICRINIDLTAGGGQSATGLEVYTCASASRASWSTPRGEALDLADPLVPDREAFTLVGKVLLKNQNQIVFSHRGFKARPPFSPVQVTLPSPAVVAQELWNKGALSLSQVAHLKVCITHMTGGGVPCIKRLEVWGQPAKTCSQELIDSILLAASESLPQDVAPHASALPMESDCEPAGQTQDQQAPSSLQELAEVIQDVPEEFLDPITLEIMPCPMLLPSGKVIDQSTLEKCNRSEAVWGRVPSDPFTGVAFTPHSQPLPHPALKARIDHFLLQHSIPGCHLLGRAQTASAVTPSSIALPSRKRKMEPTEQAPGCNLGVNASCFSTMNPPVLATTSEHTSKKMKARSELSFPLMDCSTDPVSHEQKLSQSLEIALSSTLGTMPSFTARLTRGQLQQLGTRGTSPSGRLGNSSEQSDSVLGPKCISCDRVFSPYFRKEPLYQLPCGHLLCRPCLGEKQRSMPMVCTACQRPFGSQDVLRVHF